MRSSLTTRMVLLAVVTAVIFAAAYSWQAFREFRRDERAAQAHATELARMLAEAAPIVPVETLPRWLSVIGQHEPSLMYAVLTDWAGPRGHFLALYANPAVPEAAVAARQATTGNPAGHPDWKTVWVTIAGASAGSPRELRMAYSLGSVRSEIVREGAFTFFLLMSLVGVSIASWWLAGRALVRPLQQLFYSLKSLREGRPVVPVVEKGSHEIAQVVREWNYVAGELHKRHRLRANLARFVSEAVAHQVISDDQTVHLGGKRRIVTVLFADIRGFTALTEHHPPERVVSMLNEYMKALADVIPTYGGSVDKFMGDALMAVFNAPADLENHPICAVMAGLEMRRVIDSISERRIRAGEEQLRLGIGINTGDVVAGTFGSESRMEYTVIGAAVNLAQRIEAQARQGEMLLGESTYRAVRHLVEAVAWEPVLLKGIEEPVRMYEVRDLRQDRSLGVSPVAAADVED